MRISLECEIYWVGFRFAFRCPFGLDSVPHPLREPFVNPSRPNRSLKLACITAGAVASEGAGQRNGPRHVQHVKSLRALALGLALGSAFAANLAATPAQA